MKVYVIIPAAGLGTRMNAAVKGRGKAGSPAPSKQFAELGGVPILIHTLRRFDATGQAGEIYVALRKAEMARFEQTLAKERFKVPVVCVEGGEHRQESVANALARMAADKPKPDDIVLVHDAVRPFVDGETIAGVVAAARKHGAAIAGVPAVDTLKQVDRTAEGAVISATIPRERIVLAQTPQGFRYDLLKKAFADAAADGFIGTDEASLVERAGSQVAVVMGSPRNIKITTPADLELAEFFVSQEDRRRGTLAG
jgi:2-C-methyl-D-erythritol 4-phosphate cytidylyltransferase